LPLLLVLADGPKRRAFGGALALLRSTMAEVAFSVLLAPVLMIQHSWAVIGILLGRCVTWNGQQRDGESETWSAMAALFGPTTVLGCLWAAAAYAIAPDLLLWLSPIFAGLALAIPLAALSSRADLGLAARGRGYLATPEELAPPPELAALPAPGSMGRARRGRLPDAWPAGAC
jgi:membrane glycosyltransferase